VKHLYAFAAAAIALAWFGCSDDPPADDLDEGGSAPAGMGGTGGIGGAGGVSMVTTGTSVGGLDLPASFTVEGVVLDENGDPVAGAMVLQGGKSHEPTQTSAADGSFTLEVEYPGYGVPGVVATKVGHRSNGADIYFLPEEPLEIRIRTIAPPDNPNYEYQDPGTGVMDPTSRYCGHCHETFTQEFNTSKHAQAAQDPIVQDLYAGTALAFGTSAECAAAGGTWRQGIEPGSTATQSKCYLGGGVLPDLNPGCGGPAEPTCDDPAIGTPPTAFGACADCHAPGINGVAGGRNLHDAVDLAYDKGVFCDVCHKVKDVDLSLAPGVAGRLILQRPNEPSKTPTQQYRPLMFGPLIDVPNGIMGASPQPKFKEATFCAGCHQQLQPALVPGDTLDPARWPDGLPVHTTYDEWAAGPYAASGTPCQFCHMPAHFDLTNPIDLATPENASITFGYPRPPSDIRSHIFRSPLEGEPRLIDGALFVSVALELSGSDLDASVSLTNVGCGHAAPTGEPYRSLILLVYAEGTGCSGPINATGGMTIFDVGGSLARGVFASDVTAAGAVLTWPAAAGAAQVGQIVRVVRPTGVFDDYTAPVGFFATATPAEKGLEVMDPVGESAIVSTGAGTITLASSLPLAPGDVLFLGEPFGLGQGVPSKAYAGLPGYAFAKVLTDASGVRQAPHYRAIDIASDNRIPPGDNAITKHRFAVPAGCTEVMVHAHVIYRPIPLAEGRQRGWSPLDYVVADGEEMIEIP
jgi:hypothetical protein